MMSVVDQAAIAIQPKQFSHSQQLCVCVLVLMGLVMIRAADVVPRG